MLSRSLFTATLALALGACALKPPHPDAFVFGALGDTPYNAREELALDAMLARAGAEPLAFLVHVGDLKAGGNEPCTDALYQVRRERLDRSPHPLIYTPGDNDWADCRRASNGAMDPLERLARLREAFYRDAWSLGRRRLPLSAQEGCLERVGSGCACPALPENRLWTKNAVVFATVHVIGSNDNRGFDAANDAEQRCRSLANIAWLDRATRLAEAPGQRGLVVFAQANPWERSADGVFDGFRARLVAIAQRLGRPVLFVHGDTHTYRFDRPFVDATGKPVSNLARLEVPGSPATGWAP